MITSRQTTIRPAETTSQVFAPQLALAAPPLTPVRARAIIADQKRRGFGAEMDVTTDEHSAVWAAIHQSGRNHSLSSMVHAVARLPAGG